MVQNYVDELELSGPMDANSGDVRTTTQHISYFNVMISTSACASFATF